MKNIFSSIIIALLTAGYSYGQNQDGKIILPDTISYDNVIISEVKVSGNKLTKDHYIIRELDFKKGDTLGTVYIDGKREKGLKRVVGDSSELALRMGYSRENIINTKLFLTVDVGVEQIEENKYRLLIDVNERHYWWLFPVAKLNAPNFNEWLRDPALQDISMGLFFSHNNLFGISHQTSLAGYVGESYAAVWGYRIPWIGKGKKVGLTFGAGYENLYTAEYGSLDNKRQMIYDYNALQSANFRVKFTFRPHLYNYGTIQLTGNYVWVSDSLHNLAPDLLAEGRKDNSSLSLYADYSYDTRNSKSYPLTGNNMKVFINKVGLGLVKHEVDYFYYGIDFRFYQKIGKKWYVAEMMKLENASGENHPYYYQIGITERKDFIRGYDLFTIKGDRMAYFRNNIKYELVKPSTKKVKKGQEKNKFKALQYAFYLNLFADAGFVRNDFTENNPYNNRMLFSWGLGLDFVTYYDMTLRFEYAFTSIGTNGFFFGFGMPI
jgi:outer membrane protein assembly factor BamA